MYKYSVGAEGGGLFIHLQWLTHQDFIQEIETPTTITVVIVAAYIYLPSKSN